MVLIRATRDEDLDRVAAVTEPVSWIPADRYRDELAWRRAVASAAGLTREVERLRFEWTPMVGVPESTGRLTFRAEPDDEVMRSLFRRIAVGSLDDETRKNVSRLGVDRAVHEELEFYRDAPGGNGSGGGPRTPPTVPWPGSPFPPRRPITATSDTSGFSRNCGDGGYGDEILGEITRIHAAAGAQKITGTTDLGNRPMAEAFRRAGYLNTETRVILSAG